MAMLQEVSAAVMRHLKPHIRASDVLGRRATSAVVLMPDTDSIQGLAAAQRLLAVLPNQAAIAGDTGGVAAGVATVFGQVEGGADALLDAAEEACRAAGEARLSEYLSGRPRVLVIDDDAAFANALAELLLERGWEGYPCTDVADALARIREPLYAGLFVDAVIPGTHGAKLLRESLSLYPRRPAVLMSGRDVAPDVLLDVLGLGPVTFIAKPMPSADLDLALQMFRALLPVALRPKTEPRAPVPDRAPAAGDRPRTAKKVLVVDDDRLIHTYLKTLYEKAGYKVSAALDGMQALMVARQVNPDLIVLDIAMPGGGGYQVFERLRKLAGTMKTPVLIHSAVPRQQVEKHIPEGPKVIFLAKPCLPEDILAATHKLLGGPA